MLRQFYLTCFVLVVADVVTVTLAAEAYQDKALTLHNTYRKKHHANDLKMDEEMNKLAVQCAEYYAKKQAIDHTCPHKKTYGENLAQGSDWDNVKAAKESTDMWYNEVKDYDYKKATFAGNTGHFTQLVWKKSGKFGFGYAKNNNFNVGVALYDPAGNMMGDFKNNVQQP